MTRIVTIMGSGETAPTMVKVHRSVLERLVPPPATAVLVDTPFAFQENARELSGRVVTYFRESLQAHIDVATLPDAGATPRGTPSSDPFAAERFTAQLRDARYVFAGPGSPTYALRRWDGSVLPGLLVEKLLHGGAVCFASAAALTLGAFTVPVYEIYKAGEDPRWLEGLDVLGAVGMHVAVVPHYNNAEGGTHDTRFCYLGERRLAEMEKMLPEGHVVLGVDEHTACVVDLDARRASIAGLGVVTVRHHGRSVTFSSGAELDLDELLAAADGRAALRAGDAGGGTPAGDRSGSDGENGAETGVGGAPSGATSPLLGIVRDEEAAFAAAIARRDADSAVAAILRLEREIVEWSTDIPQQDELDRAHASLRAMVVELGELATAGLVEPREVLGPFVDLLVEVRRLARDEHRFAESDLVRDRLGAIGVELRDGPDATTWTLTAQDRARN